mgnify:CR=1 FL=1
MRGLTQRPDVDQRTRQERTDVADIHGKSTFHFAVDDADDHFVLLERIIQHHPGLSPTGFFTGEPGLPEAVVDNFHCNFDLIPNAEVQLTVFIEKLSLGNYTFGLQARMDNYPVVIDIHHRAGNDGPRRHLDGC